MQGERAHSTVQARISRESLESLLRLVFYTNSFIMLA